MAHPSKGQPSGHRSNARGTLVLDVRLRGVGRLKRATGTTDARTFAHYKGMVRALYDAGLLDHVRSLRDGRVTFAELWELYRPMQHRPSADLGRLPSPETVRRLWVEEGGQEVGALAAWIASHDVSERHQDNLRRDARALRRHAKATETVRDLPDIVRRARTAYLKAGTRRMFNAVRMAVLAFLKASVGRRHPLYYDVQDIAPLHARRKPTSGMTPAEARAVRAALAAGTRTFDRLGVPTGPLVAEAWWACCVTGMRPAEYWQEYGAAWAARADRVWVRASKTGTERELPLVDPAAVAGPPRVTRNTVEEWLRLLSRGESPFRTPWPRNVSLYDGRRTFRHACEMAGVPRSRAMRYRSAKPRDVDDLYTEHAVTAAYLAEDAAKLRAYFGPPDEGQGAAGLRLVTPAGA